eukprot:scaffold14203_cov45-Phaeocystis_antarctica.AAC.2
MSGHRNSHSTGRDSKGTYGPRSPGGFGRVARATRRRKAAAAPRRCRGGRRRSQRWPDRRPSWLGSGLGLGLGLGLGFGLELGLGLG